MSTPTFERADTSEQTLGTPDPATHTGARRWLALAVVCVSVMLAVINSTVVNVALPTLGRELGASTTAMQWIVNAYTLVFAVMLLTGGGLGDRFGRKRTLHVGLVLFAASSLAAANATSTGQLIAAQAAMGVAAAFVYPATLALLSAIFTDRKERAVAIGIWSAVSGLGAAVGPVAGGLLLRHFSWQSVFLVNLPLIAVALVGGLLLLPRSRAESTGRFDVIGALLSMVGVGLLVRTVIEGPSDGWLSAVTLGGFAGAAVLLALFAWWEARTVEPLLDVSMFRDRRVTAACVAIMMAFLGLLGFVFLITQYFQVIRGYDTLKAGLAILPFAAVMGVMAPLSMALTVRIGPRLVISLGMLSLSAGFVVAMQLTAESNYWGPVVGSMVLMAAGLAWGTAPATDTIMSVLSANRLGAGSAVNDTTRQIGAALGIAVIGSVMNQVYGDRITSGFATLGLPSEPASESLVAAVGVVQQLPPQVAEQALQTTRDAFMSALHAGSLAAAIATAAAAGVVALLMPGLRR
ncbi:DHA2 family efflux MFS transporter permease subunit [Micromonospora sp. NPDC005203]|uniref:DHA2 family efflux MFS transporter permease subunit n=1 Tax=Micromonospora sp. NPDC005203 TaxID=3364226 RepID=UPI00368A1E26